MTKGRGARERSFSFCAADAARQQHTIRVIAEEGRNMY